MRASSSHQPRRGAKAPKPSPPDKLPNRREIDALPRKSLESLCNRLEVPLPPNPSVEELKQQALAAVMKFARESKEDSSSDWTSEPESDLDADEPTTDLRSQPIQTMTTALQDAATRVRKVRCEKSLSAEEVQNLLLETDLLLQGLLSGLRLAAHFQPPPPIEVPSHQPMATRPKSYREAARGNRAWQPAPPRPTTPEAHRQARQRTIEKIQDPEIRPEHTGTWEPEMQGFRQRNFSIIAFEKEICQAILQKHPTLRKEKRVIERLFRLERGGFRLQLSADAWDALATTAEMTIVTATFGTWHRRPPMDGPLGPSFVIGSVDKSITMEELKEEIALNQEIHEMSLPEARHAITGASRLKWRNPDTEELEDAFSVRVHASETMTRAFISQGIVKIGHRLCRTREYIPARRRCLNCGQLGGHIAAECRNKQVCRHCGKGHISTECPNKPDPFTEVLQRAQDDRGHNWANLEDDRTVTRKQTPAARQ